MFLFYFLMNKSCEKSSKLCRRALEAVLHFWQSFVTKIVSRRQSNVRSERLAKNRNGQTKTLEEMRNIARVRGFRFKSNDDPLASWQDLVLLGPTAMPIAQGEPGSLNVQFCIDAPCITSHYPHTRCLKMILVGTILTFD